LRSLANVKSIAKRDRAEMAVRRKGKGKPKKLQNMEGGNERGMISGSGDSDLKPC